MKKKLSTDNYVNLYIHQNRLMWSRLQTIALIQLASLSSAYSVHNKQSLALIAILFGIMFTLLIFSTFHRDEQYRNKILKKIDYQLDLKRKWYLPGGSIVTRLILYLFIFMDILFVLLVVYNKT